MIKISSNKYTILLTALFFLMLCFGCSKPKKPVIKIDDVAPWCILGFDALNRTPEQRIELLKELGFKKYGFNKGKGEYDQMIEEFDLAKHNDIEITSIFLWLNAQRDSIGNLSTSNQQLLNNLREVEQKPTIWVSFSNNYFEGLNDDECIKIAVEMLTFVRSIADEIGCKLALYNHHGWFGNPQNQINILNKLNQDDVTIVYNFHHAHADVIDFKNIAKKITPYLSFVNLNGVKKDGPQILEIGKGDHEIEMIKCLLDEGYNGPWGILGHIKSEDVKKVLEGNIEGLKLLNVKLNN